MLIENNSNLIRGVFATTLASGASVDVAELVNDRFLAVASESLSLFSTRKAVSDPLGNGLLQRVGIPESDWLLAEDGDFILEHRAGYVGLCSGKVLLIGLNDARLFSGPADALRNRNEIVRIPLA
ncbi:hypothetical protein [Parathalassolituus penaei]|uniref:Uncharacterized protein n=1 Tax=Parathalassolituus penaei TaxID=2997323 RepID=A0A9X3ED50_9GAMM|nr:hypothetical protein [Parathalassolituus penaei]MCY0964465.1 hypothetical protein [Parathalassolituus penaei]